MKYSRSSQFYTEERHSETVPHSLTSFFADWWTYSHLYFWNTLFWPVGTEPSPLQHATPAVSFWHHLQALVAQILTVSRCADDINNNNVFFFHEIVKCLSWKIRFFIMFYCDKKIQLQSVFIYILYSILLFWIWVSFCSVLFYLLKLICYIFDTGNMISLHLWQYAVIFIAGHVVRKLKPSTQT